MRNKCYKYLKVGRTLKILLSLKSKNSLIALKKEKEKTRINL